MHHGLCKAKRVNTRTESNSWTESKGLWILLSTTVQSMWVLRPFSMFSSLAWFQQVLGNAFPGMRGKSFDICVEGGFSKAFVSKVFYVLSQAGHVTLATLSR